MQRSTIGVGPALRRARQGRGVSIFEASRDTKIRTDFIQALEAEDFDRLLGDVYVRGALRSYATYLGLPSDRVLSAYARGVGRELAPGPVPPPAMDAIVGAPRHRDNHRLIGMAAAIVVVLAAAFGVLSARGSAPAPAMAFESQSMAEDLGPGISLSVSTEDARVGVTIRIDGNPPETFTLLPGESRAFVAENAITIRLSQGGTADVVVAGRDLGTPGRSSRPWKGTFSYQTGTPFPSTAS